MTSEGQKRIALLRHGKSGWDDDALSDFERPLKERGKKAAFAMGREMSRIGFSVDIVLASPAQRVVETLKHLAGGYGAELPIQFEPRVYAASATALMELLLQLDAETSVALLAGHNPGLQELALLLMAAGDPCRQSLQEKFPTAALAVLRLPVRNWSTLRPHQGAVEYLVKPRELMRAD